MGASAPQRRTFGAVPAERSGPDRLALAARAAALDWKSKQRGENRLVSEDNRQRDTTVNTTRRPEGRTATQRLTGMIYKHAMHHDGGEAP